MKKKTWTIAGFAATGTAILIGHQLYKLADEIVVTESDLDVVISAVRAAAEPYHEQAELNTWDRKWQRYQFLHNKKCHQGGLSTVDGGAEEGEFRKLLDYFDITGPVCG